MKQQLARKQAALSLVPMTPEHDQPVRTSSSLNEFLDGWLTSVSPTPQPPSSPLVWGLPLSVTDVMRVNRATVRESGEHRHWPPDVVLSFMRADVIRRH